VSIAQLDVTITAKTDYFFGEFSNAQLYEAFCFRVSLENSKPTWQVRTQIGVPLASCIPHWRLD
jgi:hypothetical protein